MRRVLVDAARSKGGQTMNRIVFVFAVALTILSLAVARAPQPTAQNNGQATDEAAIRKEEKRNEEIIRRNLDNLNRGDLKAFLQDFAEDVKNFNVAMGREGIRRGVEDIVTTFPDWRMEIVEMVAQGDSVVTLLKVSGTHRGVGKLPMNGGMLVGVEPTQKHFEVQHIHWYKIRDGKIVEHTATRNDIGMMRQLGLLPPTGLPK